MTLGFCVQRIRECVNVDVFVHTAMPPACVCERVCIFVFYACLNPVCVLSSSHLASQVTVFVMCA